MKKKVAGDNISALLKNNEEGEAALL